MSSRENAIQELLKIIIDYRSDEIDKLDSAHIELWLNQFSPENQMAVLKEITHILKKTYISKESMIKALKSLSAHKEFVGDTPRNHWSTVTILDIQKGGNSQHELSSMLANVVKEKYDIDVPINKFDRKLFYYIDDNLCSGSRVIQDLSAWIAEKAPKDCSLYLFFVVQYLSGRWRVEEKLKELIANSGKNIKIKWASCVRPEDRKRYIYKSDVLRPTSEPDNESVKSHISQMKYPPTYRTPGGKGELDIFSSEEARNLLEQEFLVKGVEIRDICLKLKPQHRPLGYSSLETLGFGSLIVTYRNCPNNAPLALWVGEPWHPLLPRGTNNDARIKRDFETAWEW